MIIIIIKLGKVIKNQIDKTKLSSQFFLRS